MKSILLFMTTCLTLISPAFGMLDEEKENKQTFTVVAHLDATKSDKVNFDPRLPGHGYLRSTLEGEYDYTTHSVSFKMNREDIERLKQTKYKFIVKYHPFQSTRDSEYSEYTHTFGFECPEDTQNNTIHLTLLKIAHTTRETTYVSHSAPDNPEIFIRHTPCYPLAPKTPYTSERIADWADAILWYRSQEKDAKPAVDQCVSWNRKAYK